LSDLERLTDDELVALELRAYHAMIHADGADRADRADRKRRWRAVILEVRARRLFDRLVWK
jgi:hypothetical protein